jgi:hypothetical protein
MLTAAHITAFHGFTMDPNPNDNKSKSLGKRFRNNDQEESEESKKEPPSKKRKRFSITETLVNCIKNNNSIPKKIDDTNKKLIDCSIITDTLNKYDTGNNEFLFRRMNSALTISSFFEEDRSNIFLENIKKGVFCDNNDAWNIHEQQLDLTENTENIYMVRAEGYYGLLKDVCKHLGINQNSYNVVSGHIKRYEQNNYDNLTKKIKQIQMKDLNIIVSVIEYDLSQSDMKRFDEKTIEERWNAWIESFKSVLESNPNNSDKTSCNPEAFAVHALSGDDKGKNPLNALAVIYTDLAKFSILLSHCYLTFKKYNENSTFKEMEDTLSSEEIYTKDPHLQTSYKELKKFNSVLKMTQKLMTLTDKDRKKIEVAWDNEYKKKFNSTPTDVEQIRREALVQYLSFKRQDNRKDLMQSVTEFAESIPLDSDSEKIHQKFFQKIHDFIKIDPSCRYSDSQIFKLFLKSLKEKKTSLSFSAEVSEAEYGEEEYGEEEYGEEEYGEEEYGEEEYGKEEYLEKKIDFLKTFPSRKHYADFYTKISPNINAQNIAFEIIEKMRKQWGFPYKIYKNGLETNGIKSIKNDSFYKHFDAMWNSELAKHIRIEGHIMKEDTLSEWITDPEWQPAAQECLEYVKNYVNMRNKSSKNKKSHQVSNDPYIQFIYDSIRDHPQNHPTVIRDMAKHEQWDEACPGNNYIEISDKMGSFLEEVDKIVNNGADFKIKLQHLINNDKFSNIDKDLFEKIANDYYKFKKK